jgi:hypothetical protein
MCNDVKIVLSGRICINSQVIVVGGATLIFEVELLKIDRKAEL